MNPWCHNLPLLVDMKISHDFSLLTKSAITWHWDISIQNSLIYGAILNSIILKVAHYMQLLHCLNLLLTRQVIFIASKIDPPKPTFTSSTMFIIERTEKEKYLWQFDGGTSYSISFENNLLDIRTLTTTKWILYLNIFTYCPAQFKIN